MNCLPQRFSEESHKLETYMRNKKKNNNLKYINLSVDHINFEIITFRSLDQQKRNIFLTYIYIYIYIYMQSVISFKMYDGPYT